VYAPPDAPAVAILASYEASEGTRDELGRLKFHDHPDFTPSLTPKQVPLTVLTQQATLSLNDAPSFQAHDAACLLDCYLRCGRIVPSAAACVGR